MNEVSQEFNPNRHHPFYFIRRGLYDAMKDNSRYLSGVMMDFGCGSKPYKALFQVDDYIGVDYSSEGHSHETEQIDVYYDGEKIPFPDNHFDSILSSEVFEHLFQIDKVLVELHRVLKPNGKMLITCPFIWNEHETPIDYARYTQFALVDLFTKHGFKVVKFEKKGTYIETIVQLLNLYTLHLLANGGIFQKIRILQNFSKRLLKSMPYINNSIGEFLASRLPKFDDIYLSNVLIVEKSELET